jgi:hypothetical protein
MRLLRLAVENQRWELAAHTIVLVAAKLLNNVAQDNLTERGDKSHVSRSKEKKGRPAGQPEC